MRQRVAVAGAVRPHGPHADRGGAAGRRPAARPARSTSPAARRSGRTPAPFSASRSASRSPPTSTPALPRRRGADRLHPPRRHAGPPRGLPAPRRQGGDRHHRLQRRAEGARSPTMREHIAIVMAPNMSVGVNVVLKLLDMAARALEPGLRHRDHRGPPPPQGRRAERHRAADGRGRRRGARPRPRATARSTAAKA